MANEYCPVPVNAAIHIADKHQKDVVVIGTLDHAHDRLHVTTFGRTPHDKVLAAEAGDVVGRALGDMSRQKVFEDFRLDAARLKAERDDLLAALKGLFDLSTEGDLAELIGWAAAIDAARAAITKAEGADPCSPSP